MQRRRNAPIRSGQANSSVAARIINLFPWQPGATHTIGWPVSPTCAPPRSVGQTANYTRKIRFIIRNIAQRRGTIERHPFSSDHSPLPNSRATYTGIRSHTTHAHIHAHIYTYTHTYARARARNENVRLLARTSHRDLGLVQL